jgi:hypothetical protein
MAVRYLGFWATPNGNMKVAMDLVVERTLRAKETIQGHPLGPRQTVEVFEAQAVGNFRIVDITEEHGRHGIYHDTCNLNTHPARSCGQMHANEGRRLPYND